MPDIAFILLYVENVAASEAFYARTLGRPAVESSPGFAMIPAAPGVMLGLWRRDEIALVACRVVAQHGFGHATIVRIAREAGY